MYYSSIYYFLLLDIPYKQYCTVLQYIPVVLNSTQPNPTQPNTVRALSKQDKNDNQIVPKAKASVHIPLFRKSPNPFISIDIIAIAIIHLQRILLYSGKQHKNDDNFQKKTNNHCSVSVDVNVAIEQQRLQLQQQQQYRSNASTATAETTTIVDDSSSTQHLHSQDIVHGCCCGIVHFYHHHYNYDR